MYFLISVQRLFYAHSIAPLLNYPMIEPSFDKSLLNEEWMKCLTSTKIRILYCFFIFDMYYFYYLRLEV